MTQIETVDTYIDLLPSFNMSDYNYMERLWAYLSVKTLLAKVERGELYSCQPRERPGARHQVCGQWSGVSHVIKEDWKDGETNLVTEAEDEDVCEVDISLSL